MLTGKITEIYDEIWVRKSKEIIKVEAGSRMDIASKLVGSGDRLLDIGCGDVIRNQLCMHDKLR